MTNMTQREEELEKRIKELERVQDRTEGLLGIMRLHAQTLERSWQTELSPLSEGTMCYRPAIGWAMVGSAIARALEYIRKDITMEQMVGSFKKVRTPDMVLSYAQDFAINDSLQQVEKCDEPITSGGRWKRQW